MTDAPTPDANLDPPGTGAAETASLTEPGSGDGKFTVRLENFEGPFDLLLQLISQHELDVTEVALHKVTDEFIAHTRALERTDFFTSGYLDTQIRPKTRLSPATRFGPMIQFVLVGVGIAGLAAAIRHNGRFVPGVSGLFRPANRDRRPTRAARRGRQDKGAT